MSGVSVVERDRIRIWLARWLLVLGAIGIGLACWSVIARDVWRAGIASTATACVLVAGGGLVMSAEASADRVFASLVDRAFDGAVLGGIAWAYRLDEPWTAAGAVVALCSSFLAAYVRARGASLGYGVDEGLVTRVLRYGLVSGGLITDGLGWALWVLAVVMVLASVVRASQVAKEERA